MKGTLKSYYSRLIKQLGTTLLNAIILNHLFMPHIFIIIGIFNYDFPMSRKLLEFVHLSLFFVYIFGGTKFSPVSLESLEFSSFLFVGVCVEGGMRQPVCLHKAYVVCSLPLFSVLAP